ncbi:hypothetical protein MCEKH45_01092 [Methylophilaceae bacterium]
MHKLLLTILLTIASLSVMAGQYKNYSCEVLSKFDRSQQYPTTKIKELQFSNIVEEGEKTTYVSRCDFQKSVGKVTCDRYKMDKMVFDEFVNIKKYYLFKSQYDFQLYDDLSFVENNGRGGISYGVCSVTSK